MTSSHIDAAIKDLTQDIESFTHIAHSLKHHLSNATKQLESVSRFISRSAFTFTRSQLQQHTSEIESLSDKISQLLKNAQLKKPSQSRYDKLLRSKYEIYDALRFYSCLIPSSITSTDWQSPSYSYSLSSQAGKQTGHIQGTINDYKRDHHLDEKEYEKLFVREYIDTRFKFYIHAYLTNSGQAAFTTILTYLQSEGKLNGTILIGKNTYFQYKQIMAKSLSDRIIEVDEHDTKGIISAIIKYKPGALFFDSLSNASSIPVTDLPTIYLALCKQAQKETYLIIDNTCLSIALQCFSMKGGNRKVRTISFESLNKYHQFGLDRVTAGIVVVRGHDSGGIFEYRKHAGTNITDSSVYALPLPNRKLLVKRLERHQRNAIMLVDYLRLHLTNSENNIVEEIVYPTDVNHFRGSFFNIKLKHHVRNRKTYERIIYKVLKTAKKQEVNIVAGTSFGLLTTRIYLTSLWSKYGEPFLRVSVGTEDRIQIEKLKNVFLAELTE